MARPTFHEVYMQVAYQIARRATCPDRKVGCVLVDSQMKVMSTGYNGVPSGVDHCTKTPCAARASGGCHAIHAEQNALLQCSDVASIKICYVTTSPCMTCAKLLSNTGCKLIVYDDSKHHLPEVAGFWHNTQSNRVLVHIGYAMNNVEQLEEMLKDD